MTSSPALFVELCAGTAALSVRLQGGPYARPLVSRMGAKTKYSKAILSIMGLRAGQGAERYVWAEPDNGCRLLLHACADPELARAAARQLEQWVDEDPRALWDRLKAEPVVSAAQWLVLQARTFGQMPTSITSSYMKPAVNGSRSGPTASTLKTRLAALAEHPAFIYSSASAVPLPDVLSTLSGRCVVYIDPPYQNTTGYAHDLTRAEVVALAMRWADVGADVYISEAEPIDLPGWYHVDITRCRQGPRRTFSKQQAEWVTCSRRPHWSPASQVALW